MRFEQMSLFEKGSQQWSESHKANTEPDNRDEYEQFLDKFKTKKTTDDCYTPANIYDAVANWTAVEYGLDRAAFVRPFFPGGDFENFDYKDDTIVVDNPPFSILSSIINFYIGNDIKFFLFAPALTLFSTMKPGVCWLPVGATITYENGAKVSTSFITNLDTARLRCVPELYRIVKIQNDINEKERVKELPKYDYPMHVLTAAKAQWFTKYGVAFSVNPKSCTRISELDSQKAVGKAIFGGGLLLSDNAAAERAAAERAAAERAAAHKWALSDRERAMVEYLNKQEQT